MGGSHGKPEPEKIYAAIDFGTINTGFAMSIPNYPDVQVRLFESDDRVPSIVLLDEHRRLKAFGHTAKTNFCALNKEEQDKYFYCQLYKLQLSGYNLLSADATILDFSKKKSMETLELFTIIIKHLIERGFEKLNDAQQSTCIMKDRVHWIITVPTIWSHSARDFMRKAAINAGIGGDNFRLVLEPKAAAFSSCRKLLRGKPKGFKYILADLGGGTVDICAHELLAVGEIKELYRSTGASYGGKSVDEKFEAFMVSLFGGEVWMTLKDEHANIFIDVMNAFEEQKKQFSTGTKSTVLRVEQILLNLLREKTLEGDTEHEKIIPETKYSELLKFNANTSRLSIDPSLMQSFFTDSVENITGLIESVIVECRTRDPPVEFDTLILAGGYSESPFLRSQIVARFSNQMDVLQEPDPRNVVARGAVLIGQAEKNCIQRIAKVTYGLERIEVFDDGQHPDVAKCTIDDRLCCKRFSTVIKKGDVLKHGKKYTYISNNRLPGSNDYIHPKCLYQSDETPLFCFQAQIVGEVDLGKTENLCLNKYKLKLDIVVDDIEFVLKATNLTTNQSEECR